MLMPVYLNRHPWASGLICVCLGLALLGTLSFGTELILPAQAQRQKLSASYHSSTGTDRDLLQDISNSTLGVSLSFSDQVLILADGLPVPEDLCARTGVTD
jgi:hypothetical protein